MIRDDADRAPSSAQQAADTIGDGVDLDIDLANKREHRANAPESSSLPISVQPPLRRLTANVD